MTSTVPQPCCANLKSGDGAVFGYVTIGTNNVGRAQAFYDALCPELGWARLADHGPIVGYGPSGQGQMLVVTRPEDREAAMPGNGAMIALPLSDPAKVDRLHSFVLELGAQNEGDPGVRPIGLYCAYWRDLDGNKFNFHAEPAR